MILMALKGPVSVSILSTKGYYFDVLIMALEEMASFLGILTIE